jgi:RES domain-containing protein
MDGMGSFRFGGRWSAAETFPAVNLSTSREGALNESNANFAYYNLSQIEVRPKVIVGIRLRLKRIIDLKDPHGISREDWLHLEELLAEDWRKVNDAGHESESQAFGRAAHDAEAEGIVWRQPECLKRAISSISQTRFQRILEYRCLAKTNWSDGSKNDKLLYAQMHVIVLAKSQ